MSRLYLYRPANRILGYIISAIIIIQLCASSSMFAKENEEKVAARWDLIRYNFQIKGEKVTESSYRVLTVINARGDIEAWIQFSETPFEKIKTLKIELKDKNRETLKTFGPKDLKKFCGFGASFQVFNDLCYYVFSESVPEYPYTIEILEEKEYTNPFFFRGLILPTGVPISSVVCSLICPDITPIRWKPYALPLQFNEFEHKHKHGYVWTGENISPLKFDTLNKVEYDWAGRLTVVVDSFEFIKAGFSGGTWADIGRWYAALLRTRYDWESLRPPGTPDHDAVNFCKETYDSVCASFRYVSISIGVGGWRPRLIGDIYRTKYGDCKDLSMLLVDRLRSFNVETYPVLILTRREGQVDRDFPNFEFNHLIAVSIIGDDTLWMDPTCRSCRFGQIPSSDQSTLALVVTDTAGILVETPGSSPEENKIVRKVNTTLDQNRQLRSEMVFEYGGQYGASLRESFSHFTDQELNHFIESIITGKSVTYSAKNYSIENLTNLYEPLRVNLEAQAVNPLRKIGKVIFLDPCVVEPDFDVSESDYDRMRPIEFSYPRSVIDSFHLKFDSNMIIDSVVFPKVTDYNSEIGNWSFSASLTDSVSPREFTVELKYSLDEIKIPRDKFNSLKAYLKTVESRDNRLIKIYLKEG